MQISSSLLASFFTTDRNPNGTPIPGAQHSTTQVHRRNSDDATGEGIVARLRRSSATLVDGLRQNVDDTLRRLARFSSSSSGSSDSSVASSGRDTPLAELRGLDADAEQARAKAGAAAASLKGILNSSDADKAEVLFAGLKKLGSEHSSVIANPATWPQGNYQLMSNTDNVCAATSLGVLERIRNSAQVTEQNLKDLMGTLRPLDALSTDVREYSSYNTADSENAMASLQGIVPGPATEDAMMIMCRAVHQTFFSGSESSPHPLNLGHTSRFEIKGDWNSSDLMSKMDQAMIGCFKHQGASREMHQQHLPHLAKHLDTLAGTSPSA